MRNITETECNMFWRASAELRAAAEQGEAITAHIDELDVLRDYTDNATLKERCSALIQAYAGAPNAQRPAQKAIT